MKADNYVKVKTAGLLGKTVAISGSTGGIGRELCFHLGGVGAGLVLIDRNMEKSSRLAAELRNKFPDINIRHVRADMSDMESVKQACAELSKMDIDYLILNAGAYSIPRCVCDTGYDNVFQINFISPYYLARKLLPSIRERGGRVVAVGSIAHNYSKIDEEDIDFSTRKKASLVYGNAKRYLTYSLLELGEGVGIAHPGITFTGITAHYPKLIFALIKNPMKLIFMPPKKASLSVVLALTAGLGKREWIGPSILDIWGMPKRKPLKTATESEISRICEIANEIYNKINI